jgi:hypothetical protein
MTFAIPYNAGGAGGGSVGGGAALYSSAQGDFSVAYDGPESLQLTGLPFVPTADQMIKVIVYPRSVGPLACTGGGTATALQDTLNNLATLLSVGDVIVNETDGSWATVASITDSNNVVTTSLKGGTANVWTATDNYAVYDKATEYLPSANKFTLSVGAAGTYLIVQNATFATTDLAYDVMLWGAPKAYDSTSDVNEVWRENPDYDHYTHGIEIADVTNGTDDTYGYQLDVDSFDQWSVKLVLDGGSGTVTATIEASWDETSVAFSSASFTDVSNDVFGSVSWADSVGGTTYILFDDLGLLRTATYVKLKIVAASGSNDGAWLAQFGKAY